METQHSCDGQCFGARGWEVAARIVGSELLPLTVKVEEELGARPRCPGDGLKACSGCIGWHRLFGPGSPETLTNRAMPSICDA